VEEVYPEVYPEVLPILRPPLLRVFVEPELLNGLEEPVVNVLGLLLDLPLPKLLLEELEELEERPEGLLNELPPDDLPLEELLRPELLRPELLRPELLPDRLCENPPLLLPPPVPGLAIPFSPLSSALVYQRFYYL
jgi:hypothetical protein